MAGYKEGQLCEVTDLDRLDSALDQLEFVHAALVDCNPMGNDRASNGLTSVMGQALDVVRRHADACEGRISYC